MVASLAHEPQVEGQVVDAGNLHGEDFLGNEQVAHIGLAVHPVHYRGAILLQGREIVCPLLVAHVHDAVAGEEHSVAAVARGHDAIHHIDTAVDGLKDVGGRAHTHQVTRTVSRQDVVDNLNHLIHHLGGLSHREAADGIAVSAQVGNKLGGFLTQVLVHTTLDDGEIGLGVAISGLGVIEVLPAACQPVVGQRQRFAGVIIVTGAGRALVKCHHDVTADGALDVHHLLGREQVLAAVDVAAECHPFIGQLAVLGQREDLEAAAVGQDGTVPAVELVQSTGALDDVHTRAQIQVVGVAQDNLCLDVVAQLAHVHRLDRTHRAHGHENGGLDLAMVVMSPARA